MVNQPPLITRDGMRPPNQAIQYAIRYSTVEYNIISSRKTVAQKSGARQGNCEMKRLLQSHWQRRWQANAP
jgi:hypothetical protein